MQYTILLFYKYIKLESPDEVAAFVRGICVGLGLTGRVIIASEGVNATLEGTAENINKFIETFRDNIQYRKIFKRVDWKTSLGNGRSFPRLSVKVRKEIVALGLTEDLDPNAVSGKYLKPAELDNLYKKGEDFVVLDMRNDYEYNVGHFRNSINPGLDNFRDLPKVLPNLEKFKDKKVVTVCTGGVRCEKASGYLIKNGFTNVYQLHGGMHRYMEEFSNTDFLGKLYVFDGRIISGPGGEHVVVGRCAHCEQVSERYMNCVIPECHKHALLCERCEVSLGGLYCSMVCSKQKEYNKATTS